MGSNGPRLGCSNMNTLLIWSLVIIVVTFLLKLFFIKPGSIGVKYLYKKKDFLMSRAEHELFDILVDLIDGKYYIFPQVHLNAMLDHKIVGQNWNAAFRHIDEKSVDFVLCDKKYIKPLLVIELDDKTHELENRKSRDAEVERILNDTQIPLLRLQNKGFFDKQLVATQLKDYLR